MDNNEIDNVLGLLLILGIAGVAVYAAVKYIPTSFWIFYVKTLAVLIGFYVLISIFRWVEWLIEKYKKGGP